MPEGPEVRRITEQLNDKASDRTLYQIEILSGRYLTHGLPEGLNEEFSLTLPTKIKSVNCKGKFIYFQLSHGWSIWSTLGMSGGWANAPTKHARLKLNLSNEDIFYNDARNFGTFKIVSSDQQLQIKLSSLGPDMLRETISDKEFHQILIKHQSKTLPEFLMDQKIISGVGNYLKAEALYFAKLSPHRTCGSLSEAEAISLNIAVQSIIRESYISGGSTFRTYQDFNGKSGDFSSRFMVYKRKTDPAGRKIIKEETKDGRATFWVPEVQT